MTEPTAAGATAPKTASHDSEPSAKLRAFMNSGWADSERDDITLSDVGVWAAKRRDALSQAFPGERLVVPAGTYKVRSNDTDYVFRPHTDYAWLAGDQTSDAVLVLEPNGTSGHDSVLYFRPRSDRSEGEEFWRDRMYGELWAGRRPSLAETAKEFGIETRHVDQLADALKNDVPTRVRRGEDASIAALLSGVSTDAGRDGELAATLSELRLVKDAFEIEQLREAVAITHRGFSDVLADMANVRKYGERWIEGTFWRRARAEGNDVGYTSIAAAGPHATTLHWIENDGSVDDGTLMLLDMGVENRQLYTADITRTLPVNGEFTPRQRELYQLVLDSQNAGIAALKPGTPFRAGHEASMEVIVRGLDAMELLPVSVEEALDPESRLYQRYTLHNVSHMLGIDVHDCAAARNEKYRQGNLEAGYVLTVEPGLYFQSDDLTVPEDLRGIGIRIEDDILVTPTGTENLSEAMPRTPEAIQTWMSS
ncbi:aminopeptidase P family protein [Kribbella sandramycini]|uniref:Xaa-Pro aminopeptidase n=1 Tax=Kribbella sandramycini TaxID=60450 RepID=A0A7Y4L735_9ACTN|nr:aminopeptidase P family protein [Kribbella sandramycini]MBB6566752.1 Xaa-Pro aminopeptidase [Kribbella sandramycini]NOL45538.1 aminopeptidase P family protein [Kribbella sandramycini]